MKKRDLTFAEGDEPLITVRVSKYNPVTGKKEPYPLGGTTAEMLIKPTAGTADNDPSVVKYDMESAISYDEDNGLILIQTGLASAGVGRKVYVVRLYQGTHPRTLLYGAWRITDI